MRTICIAGSVIAAGLLMATASPVQAQTAIHPSAEVTVVKPETVGFSSERLESLHALIQREIDQKQLAGAVTISRATASRGLPHIRFATSPPARP